MPGKGFGGRKPESAIPSAAELDGILNGCVISVGSGGTHGLKDTNVNDVAIAPVDGNTP